MYNLLITIVYNPPGLQPQMTTTVLPVGTQRGLEVYKNEIQRQYRNRQYYELTITEV